MSVVGSLPLMVRVWRRDMVVAGKGKGGVESVVEGSILVELLHGRALRNMYLDAVVVAAI